MICRGTLVLYAGTRNTSSSPQLSVGHRSAHCNCIAAMFYSTHDLCDQIRPDSITLALQLFTFLLIPVPDILQCIRISRTKSTAGVSPSSVLLRFLFCTVNLGNSLVIPTVMFLINDTDRKPRILASSIGTIKLSSGSSAYPPWTPGRVFISILCLLASAGVIPVSLAYIVPFLPTTEGYWNTLEAWSFGLNILTACLAVLQGLPQITLTTILCLRRQAADADVPKTRAAGAVSDEDRMLARKLDFWQAIAGAVKWSLLAAVWTTWFGSRLYENINFYLPVLWVVGAQTYLDYLIVGFEDTVVAWLLWAEGRSTRPYKMAAQQAAPTERTPLLTGIRWHEEGGQDI
ncbi:hypothetical protein ABW21_db0204268 [Orbilia brochopaga]|nr:hypothetical protein ABW21_db0204268 [Drechslerella brochopaga]